jgi:hypothetical protein
VLVQPGPFRNLFLDECDVLLWCVLAAGADYPDVASNIIVRDGPLTVDVTANLICSFYHSAAGAATRIVVSHDLVVHPEGIEIPQVSEWVVNVGGFYPADVHELRPLLLAG